MISLRIDTIFMYILPQIGAILMDEWTVYRVHDRALDNLAKKFK